MKEKSVRKKLFSQDLTAFSVNGIQAFQSVHNTCASLLVTPPSHKKNHKKEPFNASITGSKETAMEAIVMF